MRAYLSSTPPTVDPPPTISRSPKLGVRSPPSSVPGHLGKRLKFFENHPGTDIIWGGLEVIADRDEDAYVPDAEKGYGLIHASECMAQGTLMFRRRAPLP